jgi:adenylate cyclase class 2
MLEVERRYRLTWGDVEHLSKSLQKLGFLPGDELYQVDTYYTSKHKDFITTEECLRIRTIGRASEVTWKSPSTATMAQALDSWREEIDLKIGSQEEVAKRLLQSLDFIEYVIVVKRRTPYKGPNGLEAVIDNVQGVGWFIEIECNTDDISLSQTRIEELARLLNLSDDMISKAPYRDLAPRQNPS